MDTRRVMLAAVKMGILWGVGWVILATAINTIIWFSALAAYAAQAHVTLIEWLGYGVLRSFVVGWCAGVGFALLLAIAERNRTISTLSAVRVALWAALMSGGVGVISHLYSHLGRPLFRDSPWFLPINIGMLACFGAVAGVATLGVGRRGQRSIPLADPSPVAGLR